MQRVVVVSVSVLALVVATGACGSDDVAEGTLPPIVTTTSMFVEPATTTTLPEFYEVQSGDTLNKIVETLGVSKNDLMALNGIVNENYIQKGQQLKIPRPGMVIPTTLPVETTVAPETTLPA